MTLRSDMERAKELDAKIKESVRDPRVQTGHTMDLYAHYRTLVPRLIAQMEAMEGALRDLLDAQAEEVGAEFYAKANDAARSALAALDKE